jgi:hypothetical protein
MPAIAVCFALGYALGSPGAVGSSAGAALRPIPHAVRAPRPVAVSRTNDAVAAIPHSGPAGWRVLMDEDFEGAFPNPGWRTLSDDPDYGWWKRDCRAYGGSSSAWSQGGGALGADLACGADYPVNANHWLVYGPVSLVGATGAGVSFAYWIDAEPDVDALRILVSTDGDTFNGWYVTGHDRTWTGESVNLADVPEIGSALGSDQVWVAFVFSSDDSVNFEGAYVDDVSLRADIGFEPQPGSTVAYLPVVSNGWRAPKEGLADIQQAMPVAAFENEIARDATLRAARDLAASYAGTSALQWAGTLADDDGVRLIYAEMADGTDAPVAVVRHCLHGNCVSAAQVYTGDERGIRWITPTGDIPVRTARMPFQMRLIDERDPDGSAVIASPDAAGGSRGGSDRLVAPATMFELPGLLDGRGGGTYWLGDALAGLGEPAVGQVTGILQSRKFHLVSAFGQYLTAHGSNLSGPAASVKSAGFPDTRSVYHVNGSEVDSSISTLGPSDGFLWLTHGDASTKTGKVVGMTVARAVWGSKHYPGSRMTEQLRKNGSGGPGLVVLAGCQTADLIPVFDNGQRIVLGFNKSLSPTACEKAVNALTATLGGGGTFQQAIDAANASILDKSIQLVANPGADLSKKLADIGKPTCSPHFAGSWQGTLVVTKGSPRLPVGSSVRYDCGKFVLTQGSSPHKTCAGCWVSGKFVERTVAGCAEGLNVVLSKQDTGSNFQLDFTVIDKSTVDITNWSKDSAGADITRTGTFTRCN